MERKVKYDSSIFSVLETSNNNNNHK